MLARICSSALRPRGEVRVPVSHRGDPASIVLRLWKAVCPQNPRSTSAVSQEHIVLEPGDLRRDTQPPAHGGTDAPGGFAACSVHSRVARRWVPAFETAPSDNLSPRTGRWPPRCECVCRAVPEAPPRVAASRLDAALAPGHSRDRANVATVPAPAHSQCLAVAAGSRGCGNGPGVARDRLQATTVPRGEQ